MNLWFNNSYASLACESFAGSLAHCLCTSSHEEVLPLSRRVNGQNTSSFSSQSLSQCTRSCLILLYHSLLFIHKKRFSPFPDLSIHSQQFLHSTNGPTVNDWILFFASKRRQCRRYIDIYFQCGKFLFIYE